MERNRIESKKNQASNKRVLASRRNLLKGVGIGLAATPLASSVVAARKPSAREVYEQSLELREQSMWSNSKWYRYLESRGFNAKFNKTVKKVPVRSSDSDFTIEKYDYADFEFIITYVTDYAGDHYIDFTWKHHAYDFDPDTGAGPADRVSIGYNDDHYTKDGDRYFGPYCGNDKTIDSTGPGGVGAKYRDYDHWVNSSSNNGIKSWFGVPVYPNDNFTSSERRIYLDYKHLFGSASFDHYGWDPIIQIILDAEQDTWHQSDDIYESECTGVAYHNKGSDV